jgi:BMFP domain-containing protein YqiC
MQSQNPVLDDIARLMTGAAGAVASLREEARSVMRAQAEKFIAEMDLVGREEFEAVKSLAASARAEADALGERVAALEAALARLDSK